MGIHGIVQTAQIDASAATMILGTDSERQSIVFSAPPSSGGDYTVSTERDFVHGAGLVLNAGGGPIEVCRARHGDAVTRAWFARLGTGGPAVVGMLVTSGQRCGCEG